jgi:BirA family transcriptional regulator, biotin operon repressor / biotin---[acetyl-CoA-carboxylase] ligase
MDTGKIHYLKDFLSPEIALSSGKRNPLLLFGREPGLFSLTVFESCSSSLDMAWELIRQNLMNPGDSVLCLRQTRGRGRMGRKWLSAKGNIMAAWMIPYPESDSCNTLLSLIMGLTLSRAMLNLGLSLSIKWPNDLIYENRKVGGVLIEEKNNKLLAGIGLNLVFCPDINTMRESCSAAPGHLGDYFRGINPAQFWANLVYLVNFWYEDILCNFSLIDFIREINSNLWLMGENICIESNGQFIEGVLTGIGAKGEILVKHSGKIARVTSGSIIKHQKSD